LAKLTHLDASGHAKMVDVTHKTKTERIAVASGRIDMRPETLQLIQEESLPKGDVLAAARIAGILAAKRTADLIPLCHPLPLTAVTVDLECDPNSNAVCVTATCKTSDKTGVEMEALAAVSIASLTLYDMCKAVDRDMRITEVRLLHKSGGRSGEYNSD
tara:strand:- start:377 stop:853 length:477 start_codon:yes stop_codon:yes gene_type:complete